MWKEFYKNRINSSYQDYFNIRYKSFLDKIVEINPLHCLEEGCGIGSISKYLFNNKINSAGFDIDLDMVHISQANNEFNNNFYQDDILKPADLTIYRQSELQITHGVLEHFNDEDLLKIFSRYKKDNKQSIHYVPLDKYKVPSFGDERLLPYEYWIEISKCTEYQLFNDGYDLWFKI